MTTLPVTVGTAPVDIGAVLSASMAAANPVGPMATRGRGYVRLFNATVDAQLYVFIGESAPDGSVPPVRVRPGEWFAADVQIVPSGGDRVWAWSSRDDANMTALVTGWST